MRIYKNKMLFCESCGNSFWGNHLRCFGTKFRSIRRIYKRSAVAIDAKVLFRSFRAKTTQSTTAITSIVIRNANQSIKNPSLRDSATAESWQSKTFSSLRWSKAEDKSNFLPLHHPIARDGESQAYLHKSTTKDTL